MRSAPGASMEVDDSDPAGLSLAVRKFVTDTVGVSLVTPGCLLDTTTVIKPVGHVEAQSSTNDRTGKSGIHSKKKGLSGYSVNANSKQISGAFSGDHEGGGNSGSGHNVNKGGSGFLQNTRGVAHAGAGNGPAVSNSSNGSGGHTNYIIF